MASSTSSRARVPTPKQLSSVGVKKDEFETFWHILITYCQQDTEYLDFFEGGNFSTWQAMSVNPTRGINVPVNATEQIVDPAMATREANKLSVMKRATLNSLLTTIAAYCPDGLFKTVLTDSTSITWIRNRLIQVCNIETNGRHLPKVLDIKFNRGDESPAAFFERVRATFLDSLMPKGTKHHGVPLQGPETLSPTFESMIVIMCLKAIHQDLPDFIMQNKGMLFTPETPNFCDIQRELCETMDTLLAQMEAQSSIQRLYVTDDNENLRWMKAQNSRNQPTSRPLLNRPGVQKQTMIQRKRQSCEYCQALGKDEKIWSTHDKLNCFALFPEKKRFRTQSRMLSVPVLADEDEDWDLQEALRAVEAQYYATHPNDEDSPSVGDHTDPQ